MADNNDMLRHKFDPHELAAEELLHVYRGRSHALAVTLASGLVLAILLGWALDIKAALAWLAWLCLASLWHWQLGQPGRLDVGAVLPLEIRRHIAAAGLAGLGWGAAAAVLPWMGPTAQATLLVMLLVAVNTAMPRLVVILPMFVAYVAGAFTPLLLVLPFLAGEAQRMVGLVLAMVVVALWLSAREVRAILVNILLKQIAFARVSWEDRLTGLGNRRRFDDKLDSYWRQAARLRIPLSLIILDVDHFKKYNDTYGHQAGDECLRDVAQAIAGCVKRAGDTAARYGGEEFAVLMFHSTMTEARSMGERLRSAVQELGREHAGSEFGCVTISVGGATVVPSSALTAERFLRSADEALYRAKRDGRNRVEWSMPA